MIKFSIPYNGDIDLVKWAIGSKKIYEVYFAGPKGYDFSDPYQELKPHSGKQITGLIKYCNKNKIETNLLINKKTLFFENVSKILKYIKRLGKIGGVTSVTITDPFMAVYIKSEFPHIKLQSSIYMGINSTFKVEEAIKMGLTDFCLDPSLNRNGLQLRRIRQLKDKYPFLTIKLLGTLACYANCFYAWNHAEISVLYDILEKSGLKRRRNILGNKIDIYKCHYKTKSIADEIKRPFIRPEDIVYYEKNRLTDYIKIAYRNNSSELLKGKLIAYFNRSYSGNLFLIFDSNKYKNIFCDNKALPDNFIKTVTNCNKNCSACGYCDRIAKKYIKNI